MPKAVFPLVVAVVLAGLLLMTAGIQVREASPTTALRDKRTVVVGLPLDEARSLQTGALALGVYPESRRATDFLTEIGWGYPPRTPGRPARPDLLRRAIEGDGDTVAVWVQPGVGSAPIAALASAFEGARVATEPSDALSADVAVLIFGEAAPARVAIKDVLATDRVLVIGADARTPVRISAGTQAGVLTGGIARRRAIATPYDVAATVLLDQESPSRVAGLAMRSEALSETDAEQVLADTAGRLERNVATEFPLTLAVTIIGVALVLLGTAAMRAGSPLAHTAVRAAATIPAAYLVGLFLPAGAVVRVLVVCSLVAAGAASPKINTAASRNAPRFAPVLVLGAAAAVVVLTVVAAAMPDSRVALGLWGNPLNSWRLFGLRNHLAAFVIGGVIVGLLGLRVPASRVAWLALIAGIVVGDSVFGANFVAVATLAGGVTMALLVRRSDRVRLGAVLWAGVAAVGAVSFALALDAIAPISHGGRAVQLVGSNGPEAILQLVAERVRLNVVEINGLGVAGWVLFVASIAAVAALFDMATRTAVPSHLRGAIAGGALAALVSFVAEDSGFFTGAILGLFPWIAFIVARTTPRDQPPLDPARLS